MKKKAPKHNKLKELQERYEFTLGNHLRLTNHISELEQKLKTQTEDAQLQKDFIIAKTQLISALSWAMKTCSSIAWSDKAVSFGQKRT